MHFEMGHEKNWSLGFPTCSVSNQPVQLQRKVRGLKFRIEKEEKLYCTADLRHCFCIFSQFSHDVTQIVHHGF